MKQPKHIHSRDTITQRRYTKTHVEWEEGCKCGKVWRLKRKLPTPKSPSTEKKTVTRKRMKTMSDRKRSWFDKYHEQIVNDGIYQRCAMTGVVELKENLERHHVCRRSGKYLLCYVYLKPPCHRVIEENSKWARERGWLRNEGQGYPKDESQPRPWLEGTCINEHLLDEE